MKFESITTSLTTKSVRILDQIYLSTYKTAHVLLLVEVVLACLGNPFEIHGITSTCVAMLTASTTSEEDVYSIEVNGNYHDYWVW